MIKAIILANEIENDHALWVKACQGFGSEINYEVINLFSYDWLDKITQKKFDILLAKPPGINSLFKQIYDERIYILNKVLGYKVYPSLTEMLIYENKRFFYSWLKANNLPHPETYIFVNKEEAIEFANITTLPIVAKTNIGASGSGVTIIKNKKQMLDYINRIFSSKGIGRRWGPNWAKGNILKRGFQYILKPKQIKNKIDIYSRAKREIQRDFVIFQKFVPHEYEWRIVAIGESFFAHKKLKIGAKASGSTLKNYDNPPLYLFDFAKNIMDKYGFYSQAIDVFEPEKGKLLINEMQCIFGQSDPYQMLVDGKPGRYYFYNNKWIFEEGMFNSNLSYDLRMEHAIRLIKK